MLIMSGIDNWQWDLADYFTFWIATTLGLEMSLEESISLNVKIRCKTEKKESVTKHDYPYFKSYIPTGPAFLIGSKWAKGLNRTCATIRCQCVQGSIHANLLWPGRDVGERGRTRCLGSFEEYMHIQKCGEIESLDRANDQEMGYILGQIKGTNKMFCRLNGSLSEFENIVTNVN